MVAATSQLVSVAVACAIQLATAVVAVADVHKISISAGTLRVGVRKPSLVSVAVSVTTHAGNSCVTIMLSTTKSCPAFITLCIRTTA